MKTINTIPFISPKMVPGIRDVTKKVNNISANVSYIMDTNEKKDYNIATQIQNIDLENKNTDYFGFSVSSSSDGKYYIVGTEHTKNRVYIYKRENDGKSILEAILNNDNKFAGSFGYSVSIESIGTTVYAAVGTFYDNKVYFYKRSEIGVWELVDTIIIPDLDTLDLDPFNYDGCYQAKPTSNGYTPYATNLIINKDCTKLIIGIPTKEKVDIYNITEIIQKTTLSKQTLNTPIYDQTISHHCFGASLSLDSNNNLLVGVGSENVAFLYTYNNNSYDTTVNHSFNTNPPDMLTGMTKYGTVDYPNEKPVFSYRSFSKISNDGNYIIINLANLIWIFKKNTNTWEKYQTIDAENNSFMSNTWYYSNIILNNNNQSNFTISSVDIIVKNNDIYAVIGVLKKDVMCIIYKKEFNSNVWTTSFINSDNIKNSDYLDYNPNMTINKITYPKKNNLDFTPPMYNLNDSTNYCPLDITGTNYGSIYGSIEYLNTNDKINFNIKIKANQDRNIQGTIENDKLIFCDDNIIYNYDVSIYDNVLAINYNNNIYVYVKIYSNYEFCTKLDINYLNQYNKKKNAGKKYMNECFFVSPFNNYNYYNIIVQYKVIDNGYPVRSIFRYEINNNNGSINNVTLKVYNLSNFKTNIIEDKIKQLKYKEINICILDVNNNITEFLDLGYDDDIDPNMNGTQITAITDIGAKVKSIIGLNGLEIIIGDANNNRILINCIENETKNHIITQNVCKGFGSKIVSTTDGNNVLIYCNEAGRVFSLLDPTNYESYIKNIKSELIQYGNGNEYQKCLCISRNGKYIVYINNSNLYIDEITNGLVTKTTLININNLLSNEGYQDLSLSNIDTVCADVTNNGKILINVSDNTIFMDNAFRGIGYFKNITASSVSVNADGTKLLIGSSKHRVGILYQYANGVWTKTIINSILINDTSKEDTVTRTTTILNNLRDDLTSLVSYNINSSSGNSNAESSYGSFGDNVLISGSGNRIIISNVSKENVYFFNITNNIVSEAKMLNPIIEVPEYSASNDNFSVSNILIKRKFGAFAIKNSGTNVNCAINSMGQFGSPTCNYQQYVSKFGQSISISEDGNKLLVGDPLSNKVYLFRFFNNEIANEIDLNIDNKYKNIGNELNISGNGQNIYLANSNKTIYVLKI